MRVLVTRPASEAARTAGTLRALGHEVATSPVLDVRAVTADVPRRAWQAALFTSRNAASRSSPSVIGARTPCLAVGSATAKAVRARGFANVVEAEGDACALACLVTARLQPGAGPLVHPCGVHRTQGFVARLQAGGFEVVLAPCYETVAQPLSDRAQAMLAAGEIDVVLLYSARSARAFAAAVDGGSLPPFSLLAMSEVVADALPPLLRARTRWPARPSEPDLIAHLDRLGDNG